MSRKLALFSRRFSTNRNPRVSSRSSAASLPAAHRQIGEQHFHAEQHKLARRHYRAALRIEPNAETLGGLARAWEDDPYGSDERAFACYRRAVRLDGANAILLARLGRSAVRINRDPLAKKALAKAMRLAPGDAAVVAVVLEACREAGWIGRAWTYVCRARFAAPQNAAIRGLWNRVRFDRAVKDAAMSRESGERDVIPFLRIAGEKSHWRLDAM